jgi:hypothetical protein
MVATFDIFFQSVLVLSGATAKKGTSSPLLQLLYLFLLLQKSQASNNSHIYYSPLQSLCYRQRHT